MSQNPTQHIRGAARALAALACAGLLAAADTGPAEAAPKSRQIETEAIFQSFDAEAERIVVMVLKPGKSVKGMKKLRKGREATFRVEAEGSVLTRTTVKLMSGQAAKFTDLEEGNKVKIFWIQDEDDPELRFARSVSLFKPAEEVGEDAGLD